MTPTQAHAVVIEAARRRANALELDPVIHAYGEILEIETALDVLDEVEAQ